MFGRLKWRRLRKLVGPAFDAGFYLRRNPDVAESGQDPLDHFLTVGWVEGRDPSPRFSTAHYLRSSPDVAQRGINPLVHYLRAGRAEGRQALPPPPSDADLARARPAFDERWYLSGFPPHARPEDPLAHYLTLGWHEGRDPAPWFSTRVYLARSPDAAAAGMNPFLHYLTVGQAEGRMHGPPQVTAARLYAAQAQATSRGAAFETAMPGSVQKPQARVIAYYLPQFHAIPENDAFWGPGFTEWRNVARGLPRFHGHVQPRLPLDLGFYDLSGGESVYARQIALARAAGVHAFCFYHYDFGARRLLERPVERMLADPAADFPFLLMWANEDWTRTWDGASSDILLSHSHDPAHDEWRCDDLARHFRDPRYLRLQGRPLVMIYRIGALPDAARRVDAWRSYWKRVHGEEPLIFMAQTFTEHDPRPFGLDGAIEFPPHKANHFLPDRRETVQMLDPQFAGRLHRYEDAVLFSSQEPPPPFPLIRCAFPSWDNEARRPGRGTVFAGATPARFEAWMRQLVLFAQAHPVAGERLVAVNAWNEWAESAVLEPDLHHGHAWLNALRRAVEGVDATEEKGRRDGA